jgi:hypothetical protein
VAQLTETLAEKMDPAQAVELARLFELHAKWENMRETPAGAATGFSTLDLQERQRAYDSFRTRQAAYTARFRAAPLSEVSLNGPERVGDWARTVRAVLRRAEIEAKDESFPHVVAKAYRLVERVAGRIKVEALARGATGEGINGAVRNLNAAIQWCEDVGAPPAILATIGPVIDELGVARERVA